MVDGDTDPFETQRLDGRVAIVTGASSGLGEAAARALAGAGARVAVVARRPDRVDHVAAEIGGYPFVGDLLDEARRDELVAEVARAWGRPEILVNAAGGFAGSRPAQDETPDDIERTLALNLVAPFRLAQAVHPHMVAAGRGSIVNVSSISGIVGIPGIPQASYAAAKSGLSGLTVELAVQWAADRIRVNTVAPGFFRSEMTDDLYEGERGRAWLDRNTPLPDAAGPGDVVGAILWLAGDAGRYVTGQTIAVDGGWTAR